MNIPKDCELTYIVSREAWYHNPDSKPYVSVHATSPKIRGGVEWEFRVVEYQFDDGPSICLEIFDDAFDAFTQIPEFFQRLVERCPLSLAGLRELLDAIGARDCTERTAP
jgi:hypothetical protein